MDPVTHTLSGVALANAFFRERVGKETVPMLAVAANWPDLDAAVMLTRDPSAILWRRTFGHSLLLLPFLAAVLAMILKRLYPRFGWGTLLGLSALGMALHLFFDLINSFGVVLLWPLSDWRPELGIVFIIDVVLTGLLAAPLLFPAPRRPAASRAVLACVALYFAFCGLNRAWALQALPHEGASFAYVFPEPLGAHRWKGLARFGNRYRIYLIHSLSGRVEPRGEIETQAGDPLVERVRRTPLGRRFDWFAKAPVWTRNDGEVSSYDLRFKSLLLARPNAFALHFKPD